LKPKRFVAVIVEVVTYTSTCITKSGQVNGRGIAQKFGVTIVIRKQAGFF
jgi:hypothetical protein